MPDCAGQVGFPRLSALMWWNYTRLGLQGLGLSLFREMTLNLSFLSCKMEMMIVPPSQGCYEK